MGKWFSRGGGGRGERDSMEPPLCSNGSAGYLMQLIVNEHVSIYCLFFFKILYKFINFLISVIYISFVRLAHVCFSQFCLLSC